jgi:paraquat-inducible protein B
MIRRASPILIGSFVLGALAIALAAAFIFARGALFTKRPTFVMFFEGSVYGLQVGAPVAFRGVHVGKVTDISIEYLPKEQAFYIPVKVELEPEQIRVPAQSGAPAPIGMPALVNRGLRARLQLQSFVTGQLFIELDLLPEQPAWFVSPNTAGDEIPTVATTIERFMKRLAEFPLEKALDSVWGSLEGLNRLFNSPLLNDTLAQLNKTLRDFSELSRSLDARAGQFLHRADTLAEDLRRTVKAVEQGLGAAEKTLVQYRDLAREDSFTMRNLNATLDEVALTARSLRQLADAIERNPESFLRGKSALTK